MGKERKEVNPISLRDNAVLLPIATFLIKPGLRIKCGIRFEEGDSLVLQEVPPIATA
jgi:hypothetical protein